MFVWRCTLGTIVEAARSEKGMKGVLMDLSEALATNLDAGATAFCNAIGMVESRGRMDDDEEALGSRNGWSCGDGMRGGCSGGGGGLWVIWACSNTPVLPVRPFGEVNWGL